jgi:hypothetical protein
MWSALLQVAYSTRLFAEFLKPEKLRVFQKEFYSGIPNVSVWGMLRKRLRFKTYKLSIVQGVAEEGRIRTGKSIANVGDEIPAI